MRRSIHGVEVAVTGPHFDGLLDELLGGFPEGDAGVAPHLAIELVHATAPPPQGGRPLFFHGVVQATGVAGATFLTDGASTARVAGDGRRIDLSVAPASLADRHTLEHVLALLALVVALRRFGLFHLHAAALARPDGRAILLVGGAGSGKSTLALALLEAAPELAWLGDDAALLAARPAGPTVLGFPRPFHLSDATAEAFPRLGSLLGARYGVGPKRRLEGRLAFPDRQRLEAAAPVLVILPEVVAQPVTGIEAVPDAEALGALIESAAFLVVDGMPAVDAHLGLLAAVASGATCLRARLGKDLLHSPVEVARRVLTGPR